ncbi:MAG: DeoR/GlpR transcriptional regulator, partial [Candidatus Obscuribacter sp.]|nr:DeoR/GlpR transcriptional regulator [Candidatus Obscuribacter sp.]
MLASERRNKILEQLQKAGQISTQSLVRAFDVSEDTVRRDLKELAESGVIKKVHGGAVLTSPVPYTHEERQNLNLAAKSAIGRQAAELIKDKMLVFVDGSTTALQLIPHLRVDLKATFITHSPLLSQALSHLPDVEIILLGGKLVKDLLITQAPDSQLIARRYRPDLCVI